MKVIAINDAPIPLNGYHYGSYIERAYYKGDIFDVYDSDLVVYNEHYKLSDASYLIIYHDVLKTKMDVNPHNFIKLEDFRNQKLEKLGI